MEICKCCNKAPVSWLSQMSNCDECMRQCPINEPCHKRITDEEFEQYRTQLLARMGPKQKECDGCCLHSPSSGASDHPDATP
jgi:hypothetical protein